MTPEGQFVPSGRGQGNKTLRDLRSEKYCISPAIQIHASLQKPLMPELGVVIDFVVVLDRIDVDEIEAFA